MQPGHKLTFEIEALDEGYIIHIDYGKRIGATGIEGVLDKIRDTINPSHEVTLPAPAQASTVGKSKPDGRGMVKKLRSEEDLARLARRHGNNPETRQKILELAREQILLTGKYKSSDIVTITGLSSGTVDNYLTLLQHELADARKQWEEERDKPMGINHTQVDEDQHGKAR